MSKLDLRGCTT